MDIAIQETGNGGDFILKGDNIQLTEGLFNFVYLGLFGGNVAQSTNEVGEDGLRFDYWGNDLFFSERPELQFNSTLERTLDNIVLNSSGRAEIEAVVKENLSFMNSFADIEVDTFIEGVDRVRIEIRISEPDGFQEQRFVFLWNGTEVETITQNEI